MIDGILHANNTLSLNLPAMPLVSGKRYRIGEHLVEVIAKAMELPGFYYVRVIV